jgi:TetR/AcrR family transcriptional regulator, transcriptional repressor for nem operon
MFLFIPGIVILYYFFSMPKVKLFNEEEVLDSITQLFWTKGYNGTSIDELVKASGLSRSSLYDTFGDKHSLFIKSLQHYTQQSNSNLTSMLEKISSPRKKIEFFFRFSFEQIVEDKKRKGCFMVNSSTELGNLDKHITTLANDNMDSIINQFAVWIKEGQKMGEIKNSHPPRQIARGLYAAFCGLRVMGQTKPDKQFLADTLSSILSTLD